MESLVSLGKMVSPGCGVLPIGVSVEIGIVVASDVDVDVSIGRIQLVTEERHWQE